jgi:hypothetical protein
MALIEIELRQLKAQEDGRVTHLYEWTYADGHKEYRAQFNNGNLSEEITKKQYDRYSEFMTRRDEFITHDSSKEHDFKLTAFWTYKQEGNGLPKWFNLIF